jgi:hypothetical protein
MKYTIYLLLIVLLFSCKTAPQETEKEEPAKEPETAQEAAPGDSNYLYGGSSTIIVKPGRVRTLSVSYNITGEEKVKDEDYIWVVVDSTVVSIRGNGSKCNIVGRKEGTTTVIVSNPGIPLPYSFAVICTQEEQEKTLQRIDTERSQGRMVSGYSNLQMQESIE